MTTLTDLESNVTHITIDGFVDLNKYRYVYFVIMFIVYALIIFSNSVIIYLIIVHKNLHEPMYVFIAALSVNSLLFSTAVYPKILTDVLSEKQIISFPACLFQYFMLYSLGGSDFLLLAAMAYDRYVSICKPLQYATIMRKSTVTVFLFMAWFVPSAEMAGAVIMGRSVKLCTFTLKGIFCNGSVYKLHCVTPPALQLYGMVVLLNITLLPVIFILFTYIRIFIITHKRGKEVRKKAAETCLPHLLVLFVFSFLCSYDVISVVIELDIPKTIHLIMALQVFLCSPLFNPIIYGLKMTEIFKYLKMLFCQFKHR